MRSLAIKAFARLMIDDHAEVESRLAALDVKVPIGTGREDERIMQRLVPPSGAAFDREFIQAQVKDHSDDIKHFDREDRAAKNPQTIPILQQHLALAKAVDVSLGSENVGSSSE